MTVKGKDFKKAVEFIKEFLAKLPKDADCAELRDCLNLTLLHMKKYFKSVWLLNQEKLHGKNDKLLTTSLPKGVGTSPFNKINTDQFQWKWVTLEPPKVVTGSLPIDGEAIPRLPLILQASKEGDAVLINQLIEKDPSCVNAQDDVGRTAVMYAVHFGSDDCLEILLSRGARVNESNNDGVTATHICVLHNDSRNLKLLMSHGADLAQQDSLGRSPLHWAAKLESDDCLQILVKCNIKLNVGDKEGLTPAMWACHFDRKRNFETLLNVESYSIPAGDGIERDRRGRTWIHWSVYNESPDWSHDCLKSLLSSETAAVTDSSGKTALHLASEIGALEACRILLAEDVGSRVINIKDKQGRTCLHLAVLAGHGEVANFLLEKGVDLELQDCLGNTAWTYSDQRDLHYCRMILRSYQTIQDFRQQKQLKKITANSHKVNSHSKALPSLSSQTANPSHTSEKQAPMFNSVPTPRPGLSPRTSNLTRVEDLDSEDDVSPDRTATVAKGEVTDTQPTNHTTEPVDVLIEDGRSPAVVQYVTTEGELVQSAKSGVIDREMQPSAQVDGGLVANESEVAQPTNSPDSIASNNSMDFGMDVSDIEENNNDTGRLEGKSLEMIPPDLVVPPPYNPDIAPQRPTMVPRPPDSKVLPRSGNNQQISQDPALVGVPTLSPKSGDHQVVKGSHSMEPTVPPAKSQPAQPPSPRRLTPLSTETGPLPQVKGEVKSKKKKKKKTNGPGLNSSLSAPSQLTPEYAGGHPPVRPASPSFPLPLARTPSPSGRTPLTRGRPDRPSTPPPPSNAASQSRSGSWEVSWEPRRPSSPNPQASPRDQRPGAKELQGTGLYPPMKPTPGSMKMPLSGRSQGPLNPMRPPSPRGPTAPLTPKLQPDKADGKIQPFLPTPPGGR